MLKRRSTLDIDDVMYDVIEQLEVELDDDAEDNLNELAGDQDDGDYDNIIDHTEEDINEDESDSDVKETINQRQGHFRKYLTHRKLAHCIDTSLDENNYETTRYLNGTG